jgi:hypothetical protein
MEENKMLKKPNIVGILFIITVFALVAASTQSNGQMRILSKKSHAEKLWKTSGHADLDAEAFVHWDEDDPPEVPASCAKCHSTPGFQDFIADGTVNGAAPIGTTVECLVCHIDEETGTLRDHTAVTFPSGITVENLGAEALCMECHQGRASKKSVDDSITAASPPDDDTISSALSFINTHYYAAAANQFGTVARGGYEYSGKTYDARFSHVTGYNACITCHNPHSLDINIQQCNTCHTAGRDPRFTGVYRDVSDPKDIRFYGSFVDYDGDGDIEEGIYYEIPTFEDKLYAAIQEYGKQNGKPVVYDSHTHPYFFNDTNRNGAADPEELNFGNQYRSWTARLIRAAYNLQVAKKDPAAFAHGGKYIIQLLYDSTEDLNSVLTNPVSLSGMHRGDEGHFDGSSEAWRHWDEEGEVSGSCARCHSAEGLAYYLENGENVEAEIANGMLCTTCHTSPPTVRVAGPVMFPSGLYADLGDSSNLCINCHQGRASKSTIDTITSTSPGPYTFTNIHYYPVGAVLFGTEVKGGYEFEGKTYVGRKTYSNHNGLFDTCVECHMGTNSTRRTTGQSHQMSIAGIPNYSDHNVLKPNPEDCVYCHGQDVSQPNQGADPSGFKFSGIRPATTPDYDGDGNTKESTEDEIKGLEKALYAQIQFYATNVLGYPIIYDSNSYPYFFNDKNGNGEVDPGEAIFPNMYTQSDAKLLRAAYNYQASIKEPHGFIHNSKYVAELLVDSIEHLGGDISAYSWR